MNILVTGSTGFIGRYVIPELLKQGHEVTATARNFERAQAMPWFDKVNFVACDLHSTELDPAAFFEVPDILIHMAWPGLPNYKEHFHFENNLFESYYFIKRMTERGLRHLCVIGTCFEYGMKEGCLSEDMPTTPCTSYGLAKDTLRKFIEVLAVKYSFCWKWIRLFYLYGEGQSKNSILEQLKSAIAKGETVFPMSGGEQQRDYLFVEKAAEYIVKISTQTYLQGIFNCSSGEPISIRALVEE
ncbi:MAG: NAD-dependent epimerase/dehydratase family protein, partial [Desulfobacterium sp.]|nr:NAD-dependent epimerase/dehydratase family protein [Desulfobacterium sp.]MBU4037322.1 NAD-dependent epimerase/dehydratase family protein [Pseudomonadota bacterium]